MSNQRPLSPHITIYKPQITSIMSILHRISGVGVSFALVFFVWFLMALAGGEDSYNYFVNCAQSILGNMVLALIIVGLYYHLFNGIRHLGWDAGFGYKIECLTRSGVLVLILTAIASMVTLISIML